MLTLSYTVQLLKNKNSVILLIYHSLNSHETRMQNVYKILDTCTVQFGYKQDIALILVYIW